MWADVFFNGFLCAAAVSFAAHGPSEQRKELIQAGCVFAMCWMLYIAEWSYDLIGVDLSLSSATGLAFDDVAAVTDFLFGLVAISLGHRYWWGWALWGVAILQQFAHSVYWWTGQDFAAYTHTLDVLFVAQVAVFLVTGGPGVRNSIHHFAVGCRLRRRAISQALARAKR